MSPAIAAPGARPTRSRLLGFSRLALAAGGTVILMFLFWEGIEIGFGTSDVVVHTIHAVRGISTSLITAAVIGCLTYINHRRTAVVLEEEVASRTRDVEVARSFFEGVVDRTPAGLIILDKDFKVVHANATARRLHAHEFRSGERCFTAVAGRDVKCVDCPADHVWADGAMRTTPGYRTDQRTGEVVSEEFHPLALPDGTSYILVVERIVTEQQKLQASLLHQEKMAAFGLLAAGIAHDMGNPLSAIDMHLQLLAEEQLPAGASSNLDTVRREVARLRRTLRDLVNFARRPRTESALVSIRDVVNDTLNLLRYDPRIRKIEIGVEADGDIPPVRMVEDHLVQVTLNLMLNSLDAMPGGGKLRIEIRSASNVVALRVHDTGVGMRRDILARCTEPLFTTKPPGQGSGLGLSICKDILQAAGGALELHSAEGRGTTAIVSLPAVVTTNTADRTAASEQPEG